MIKMENSGWYSEGSGLWYSMDISLNGDKVIYLWIDEEVVDSKDRHVGCVCLGRSELEVCRNLPLEEAMRATQRAASSLLEMIAADIKQQPTYPNKSKTEITYKP